ncbi:unnamed protein product [Linum trigynum]|uniref:Retrovirus-related Pol polyprotein from transposon TNT 1-94-like beta-barrel domain-containing protein n=1 Tax=Linum trigynum TaxID=586398 RepID=A0AAV2FRK9_9ROSI
MAGHIVLDCPSLKKRGKQISFPNSGTSAVATPSDSHPPSRRTRTAYAVSSGHFGPTAGSSGSTGAAVFSPDLVRKLFQEALHEALPQALTSTFATGVVSGKSSRWLLDSGAFNHMTHARSTFDKIYLVSKLKLRVANGAQVPVLGRGTSSTRWVTLPDTLYVPSLLPDLVSVWKLTEDGCNVTFNVNGCVVQDKRTGTMIEKGSKQGRVFVLDELRP